MFLVLSQTFSAVKKTFMSWTKLSTLEMEQRWTVTETETVELQDEAKFPVSV